MPGNPGLATAFVPEAEVDQGDPFLIECPPESGEPYRYFVYVTSAEFPVYGGDDLLDPESWQRVGNSFPGRGSARWCWAPCVRYVAGLARPWVMLYSLADGAGDPAGHQGHMIIRADSVSPAGPFTDSGHVLTPDLDFAIDPEVSVDADGPAELLFAVDFVADEPYGTGIVSARISADLTRLESEPALVARPSADWQVYDEARSMPWKDIPGVRWDHDETVRWSTIEGPAELVSPGGRRLVLYSGGNFADFYGVGILAEQAPGDWVDLSPTPAQALLGPHPEVHLYGPGHCSVLTSAGRTYMCYHFRREPAQPRQFAIVELEWDAASDLPRIRAT